MAEKTEDKDYARYARNPNGTYNVVMAFSREILMQNLTLEAAAEYVRGHNANLVKKRGW